MGEYGLNERQRRFADNVLKGMSQTEAYIEAGYKSRGNAAETNAARLIGNDKVAAYLADRREKLAEVVMADAADAVREWTQRAFFTFKSLFAQEIKGPEDILKLPEQTQRLIKGCKWDQHGNFVLELVDRDQALDKLSRIFGLYQADAQNWQDKKADLLNELFWQWVISHHLHTGKSVAELATYGRAHPEEVEAWGEEVGFLEAGDDAA